MIFVDAKQNGYDGYLLNSEYITRIEKVPLQEEYKAWLEGEDEPYILTDNEQIVLLKANTKEVVWIEWR